jgi:hypothetical protein
MSILRCVLHGKYSYGDETRNVFHFGGADADTSNAQTVLDDLITALMTPATNFGDGYSFIGGTFYDEATPGVPGVFLTPTGGDKTGTSTSDELPGQVALLINMWAPTTRPNRKRSYMAGLTEGAVTAGLWASTVITNWNGVCDDLLDFDTITGLDVRLGAFGPDSGSPPIPSINYITEYRVESVPATQRRRRRGTGI